MSKPEAPPECSTETGEQLPTQPVDDVASASETQTENDGGSAPKVPADDIGSQLQTKRLGGTQEWEAAGHAKKIGPYRLLTILGSGGMGVVYLAEQAEPVKRRVALKVIRNVLQGRESRQRFEVERQALARLNHPNIAQLFDAGTTSNDCPYFAMEVVEGTRITDYCDQHELRIRQRLDLFQTVCEAVQHAHQKGVIHRDLKPSNVLVRSVDGRPVAKVIDFGTAKAIGQPLVDETLLTGDRAIGTPAYMSPEALDGGQDLDTRTDVYSLGVLLYEILVGVRPFSNTSYLQMLHEMATAEITPPSTVCRQMAEETLVPLATRRKLDGAALTRRLKGDLDSIVLMAIAKDRDDRYKSPSELAADIDRHRRHEPVEARRTTLAYRLGKLARRYRRTAAAALLLLIAAFFGTIGTSVGMLRARREAALARQAEEGAEEVIRFLLEIFKLPADFGSSEDPERRGSEITAREILERGAATLRERLPDRPLTRARMMHTIGSVFSQLEQYEDAGSLLEEALAIRIEHLGENHAQVADTLASLGFILRQQARFADAETVLQRALDIREQSNEPAAHGTVSILSNLALARIEQGAMTEAEPLLQRAVALGEQALGVQHPDVVEALDSLAILKWRLGRPAEAEELLRQVCARREAALGPHPALGVSLRSLGMCLMEQEQYAEAEVLYRRSATIMESALGPHSAQLGTTLSNLANLLNSDDRVEEAEQLNRRALQIFETALGPDHPSVAASLLNLGESCRRLGRIEEAGELLLRSLAIREQAFGPDHFRVAYALHALGHWYGCERRWDEAEQCLRRALRIRQQSLPAGHPLIIKSGELLVELLQQRGRDEEAARLEAEIRIAGDPQEKA